ncbi:hypothetical protein [Stenotrophomonas sp. CFBP 13725]|uniref:hypothetical protein n=1 Tax=Stenotrophomonas sp. CFBP 13725 TaxID=2775297 RepID=UPI00177CAD98|nr:hypothetical protein [Stenotrophomonas sp. CFBP 13725]MBD8635843.1 hypothetical protein [Stenotrophomonas sp. CFBP 13725]
MAARGSALRRSVAPWMGLCSCLGLLVGVLVEHAARLVGATGNSPMAVGVLAAAMCGFGLMLASRVREERWPWLGLAGAALSSAPLLLFLASMLMF